MNELYGGSTKKLDKDLHKLFQKLGRPAEERLELDQPIVTFQEADYGVIAVYHKSKRQKEMITKLVRVASWPWPVCKVPANLLQNLTEINRKRKRKEAAVQNQLT